MISTRNLTSLPKPDALRRLLQALALLDAILEEEWQYRYYSFNAKWSPTEQMGSMRNGSGDDFFAVFDSSGCFLRGFSHESPMTPWRETPPTIWPGVLDAVPPRFERSLKEPAFHMEDTTFCIWCLAGNSAWSCGPIEFPANEEDPDGSLWMLSALDGNPETYQLFVREYFELEVKLGAISRVFEHEPLSVELLQAFPCSRNFQDVIADAEEIGYPIKP
ncbi:MAG TPA: hypothetical protein PKZ22_13575 [Accumulibacter sp.]|jgi:hypothetical protein|nr:hypothetical protein [Accumulibacter sp.]